MGMKEAATREPLSAVSLAPLPVLPSLPPSSCSTARRRAPRSEGGRFKEQQACDEQAMKSMLKGEGVRAAARLGAGRHVTSCCKWVMHLLATRTSRHDTTR